MSEAIPRQPAILPASKKAGANENSGHWCFVTLAPNWSKTSPVFEELIELLYSSRYTLPIYTDAEGKL